jgi:hypothetical protein
MGKEIVDAAPASMYPLIIVVLSALLLAVVSMVMYFLKDLKASFERAQKTQDDRIDSLNTNLSDLKARLPIDYVLRDDYVRAVAALDLKIDRMFRELTRLSKGLAKFMSAADDAEDGGE